MLDKLKNKKKQFLIVILVLVLIMASAAAYLFFHRYGKLFRPTILDRNGLILARSNIAVSGVKRDYPLGRAASTLVGISSKDGVGQEGIEFALDFIKKKPYQDLGVGFGSSSGKAYRIISTSIDSSMQKSLYEQLMLTMKESEAKAGSAIAADALTGEVLALVSAPGYDPTNRKNMIPFEIRNRPLTDVFEPSEVFSPIAEAVREDLALEKDGLVPDVSTARSNFALENTKFGEMFSAAIVKYGHKDAYDRLLKLGLGERPTLELPGAVNGRVPLQTEGREVERRSIARGYRISMSLVQLAQAYQVLGDSGKFHRLTLVNGGLQDQETQAIRPEVANAALEALVPNSVSASSDGLFGRSGSIRKMSEGRYSEKLVAHVYAGLVVSANRKIVFAFYVDEPTAVNKDPINFAEKAAGTFFNFLKVGHLGL